MARIGLMAILLTAWLVSWPVLRGLPSFAPQRTAGIGGLPDMRASSDSAAPRPSAAAPEAAPAKPALSSLGWLAGNWQGQWGQRIAEQNWMVARGGLIAGTLRLVENRKALVIELFTVEEDKPGRIVLRFRHFTPELVPWEKENPTLMRLVSADRNKIVFENPVDGEPKRTIFTRVDDDTYVQRSEIVPEKGTMQVTEITYHRQKGVPSTPKKHHWYESGNSEPQQ